MSICGHLNVLSEVDCRAALSRCCASTAWVDGMLARLPFASDTHVQQAAAEIWWSLGENDWLEALAAHPRIGNVAGLREKYAATREWAAQEQGGMRAADETVLWKLAELNREYEARFGFLFVVCASGKSAVEMLRLLESRIDSERAEELRIAAGEQLQITLLRLTRLAEQP